MVLVCMKIAFWSDLIQFDMQSDCVENGTLTLFFHKKTNEKKSPKMKNIRGLPGTIHRLLVHMGHGISV